MSEGKRTGRPTKLTEDTQHYICELVRQGNPVEAAAAAAGVHRTTVYGWLERGEADLANDQVTPFSDFFDAFTRAKGESEAILVKFAFEAAQKDGRVALEMLARRFPERWARQDRIQHSGNVGHRGPGGPVETPLHEDRLNEVASILAGTGVLGAAEVEAEEGDDA